MRVAMANVSPVTMAILTSFCSIAILFSASAYSSALTCLLGSKGGATIRAKKTIAFYIFLSSPNKAAGGAITSMFSM